MRLFFLFTILMSFAMGCKSQKSNTETQSVDSQASPGLTLLMSDNYGGTPNEEIQVIKSQGALSKFFIQVNKTRKPGLTPPKVDFSKNMVIAYCSGETYKQGLPELYGKDDSDDRIVLMKREVASTEKQENKALLMPFGLYIMPLTEKEIVLQNDSRP